MRGSELWKEAAFDYSLNFSIHSCFWQNFASGTHMYNLKTFFSVVWFPFVYYYIQINVNSIPLWILDIHFFRFFFKMCACFCIKVENQHWDSCSYCITQVFNKVSEPTQLIASLHVLNHGRQLLVNIFFLLSFFLREY